MSMISEQIEELRLMAEMFVNGEPYGNLLRRAAYTIEMLSEKAREPKQEWIPCSERLPEEEGWYLVTIQNDKTEKRRTENDLFAIGITEAHKHTPYKFCKDGHRQTVIAWMPIPKPWKGADDIDQARKDRGV